MVGIEEGHCLEERSQRGLIQEHKLRKLHLNLLLLLLLPHNSNLLLQCNLPLLRSLFLYHDVVSLLLLLDLMHLILRSGNLLLDHDLHHQMLRIRLNNQPNRDLFRNLGLLTNR